MRAEGLSGRSGVSRGLSTIAITDIERLLPHCDLRFIRLSDVGMSSACLVTGGPMSTALILLALSAVIGLALGMLFSFPAIVASSVAIAVLSSAVLQIQGFGAIPGIAIVVACLVVNQMAYLAASLRPRLSQEQAHKKPSQGRNEDVGY